MRFPYPVPHQMPTIHGIIGTPHCRPCGTESTSSTPIHMSLDDNIEARFPASRVYCNDRLLRELQLPPWRPYPDSKGLVDRPLKMHPDKVLELFDNLPHPLTEEEGLAFLSSIFEESADKDTHIIEYRPDDFNDYPPSFTNQYPASISLRDFAMDLKRRWAVLSRKFENNRSSSPSNVTEAGQDCPYDIVLNPRSSLIPLPFPFIIPGGRFREVYYWDTLWIVHGLITCDMVQSAQNAARNLLYLVHEFGFVPNGNRVYYLSRSQPPVLPEVVNAIFEALPTERKKIEWLSETIPTLEKEYNTFTTFRHAFENSSMQGNIPSNRASLSLYRACSNTPRPESYWEDVHTVASAMRIDTDDLSATVEHINADPKRAQYAAQMYQDIASGAESGWDFSSRWFGNGHGMKSIQTTKMIPVCLNSILLRSEQLLSSFHAYLASCKNEDGDDKDARNMHNEKSDWYAQAAKQRAQAMMEVLWSSSHGMWMDYDCVLEQHSNVVSCAGVMPLWAGCWEGFWSDADARMFVQNLMVNSGLVICGGLAATTETSKQQWDFPNCWPPLVDFVVSGLRKVHHALPTAGAAEAAEEIAMRSVRSMYLGWKFDSAMHEKYDASEGDGTNGSGGEYESQNGFGWTNGVALKLMKEYKEEIANAKPGRWFS